MTQAETASAHEQLRQLRHRIDPLPGRWLRRAVTIPLYLLLAALFTVFTTPTIVVLFLADLLRRRTTWPLVRAWLFLTWYLLCETAGIAASLFLWMFTPVSMRVQLFAALQRAWSAALFSGLKLLYNLEIDIDGLEQARQGPFLLCLRHASTADTLLAAYLVANQTGILLRYVLKAELLADPCLDIVGGILPNAFVRRGGKDRSGDLEAVAALGQGLHAQESALIFPEGTRFSPGKQKRALESLSGSDPERYLVLKNLRSTLPPRPGGMLALLAQTDCDAVFVAHRGFESTADFRALLNGELTGSRIEILIWRVSRADIPEKPDAQLAWLDQLWLRMDAWVSPATG